MSPPVPLPSNISNWRQLMPLARKLSQVPEALGVVPEDTPLVAVLGVGFVGEGLVDAFSSRYKVLGFDINTKRVNDLRQRYLAKPNVKFTTEETDLGVATHFLVAVPTLLLPDRSIDLSYLRSALSMVGKWARRGSTVVIESSVAVGLTRELLGPIARSRGLFAGMSPERIDPGRTEPPMHSIPKIVSGLDDVTPGSLRVVSRLYGRVFDTIVPVSKPEVAEMAKLYENCQRMVCIAYANEMADACASHGINAYEVSDAAATKPFGYLPFEPSLGVGGHCIPVNPYYLLSNCEFPLLHAAADQMGKRPAKIARRVVDSLFNESRKREQGQAGGVNTIMKRVLVVGIGFKAGQSHIVNSPGLELANELAKDRRVHVMFADPLVRQNDVPHIPRLADKDWKREELEMFDMIVVSHRQWGLDYNVLGRLDGVFVQVWCQ
ncbi:polysaccharide biosynthesis protein vipA/tviB [Colletotrichum higginsianum]|uniref:Polysaccharide biosynthesis protein vipA/tviB n=1 Tax=Colletotrichum higginsianum (strain IMI 349063) TaxID=759273 RepID=H1W1R4_COLHI|nr:UDP-glucose 6-dehydrogenase [Colletotrichum higginsianum IMI 349063]OBR02732.1 UDP-glucose 6-dehydrogenase [Colletotrichum higginsianum IMI 349063]GJD00689.1 UDP-glucose 6-dehydrogenase [Colletotrichum higginsianum]CCF46427.1 polysaccharide biosynthesis protein vipA/tviB [Colletotrichum higginsianum]